MSNLSSLTRPQIGSDSPKHNYNMSGAVNALPDLIQSPTTAALTTEPASSIPENVVFEDSIPAEQDPWPVDCASPSDNVLGDLNQIQSPDGHNKNHQISDKNNLNTPQSQKARVSNQNQSSWLPRVATGSSHCQERSERQARKRSAHGGTANYHLGTGSHNLNGPSSAHLPIGSLDSSPTSKNGISFTSPTTSVSRRMEALTKQCQMDSDHGGTPNTLQNLSLFHHCSSPSTVKQCNLNSPSRINHNVQQSGGLRWHTQNLSGPASVNSNTGAVGPGHESMSPVSVCSGPPESNLQN